MGLIKAIFKKVRGNLGDKSSVSDEEKSSKKEGDRKFDPIEEVKALEEDEKKMVSRIIEFGDTSVKEIMVPRIDVVCTSLDTPLEKVKELINKHGHSRIPIYKDNIDNIIGTLHAKDLLLIEREKELDLSKLVRKPYFIPESKKIDELLKEMKKEKIHLAVVVDEYGGTSGLVTMEDILEEIVGEIQDEYDMEEEKIKRLDEKNFRVSANISIEDLNAALDTDIPEKEFETVGGYIYDLVGSVPREGEILESSGLQFTVEKVVGQRIKTVKVSRLKKPQDLKEEEKRSSDQKEDRPLNSH
jgi:putative hemolysin